MPKLRDVQVNKSNHHFYLPTFQGSSGQQSLFNVMKAYSLHDREVGYCQGSGFIVGLLLMQVRHAFLSNRLMSLNAQYRLATYLSSPHVPPLAFCGF